MKFSRATDAAGLYGILFNVFLLAVMAVAIFRFASLREQSTADRQLTLYIFAERDWLREMINEETGVRGYVATGDPQFLDVYYSSRQRLARADAYLAAHANGSPVSALQASHAMALGHAVQNYLAQEVSLVREGRRNVAQQRLLGGKTLFDRLRSASTPLRDAAQFRLFHSLAATVRLSNEAIVVALAIEALLLLSIATFLFVFRGLQRARRSAFSDPLTGVPNRRHALETLRLWLNDAKQTVGAVYLDLDGFKKINDHYGHATGDAILQTVAHRLNDQLRGEDFVARMGGDEFLCLIGPGADAAGLQRIAARLNHALTRPYVIGDQQFVLGCSFGWAISSPGDREPQSLISRADQAMYAAKVGGGGVYSADLAFPAFMLEGALAPLSPLL